MFHKDGCNWTTGFRTAQSAPNSAGRSKPVQENSVSFEVRMNDFPELAGVSLGKAEPAPAQKVCWGPTTQPRSPQMQTSSSSLKVSTVKYEM